MRCLIDTNIAIDYLRHREPFYKSAELLMGLGAVREFDLWMGVSQVSDLLYNLTDGGKPSRAEYARCSYATLRKSVGICTLNQDEVDEAIANNSWQDLEDSLVYQSARSIRADVIITRNQRDFAQSRIPVFDCDGFFTWLRDEKGIVYDYIDL